MEAMSIKDKLDVTAKFISIIASILGGFFWLHTYKQDVDRRLTEQQKETIRYHELYNSKEMLAARETFANLRAEAFRQATPVIRQFRNQKQIDEQGPKLQQAAMLKLISDADTKTDIPRLVNFYDQLGVCVKFKMCDPEAARLLFKGEAYDMLYILGGYIKAKRLRYPDFASSLEELGYDAPQAKARRIMTAIEQQQGGSGAPKP